MPDYSVYNTIINSTNEELRFKKKDAEFGHWVDETVPSTIPAKDRHDGIQIKNTAVTAGTKGHLQYFVMSDESVSSLQTYVTCPWGASHNVVKTDPVTPQALYEVTWRAKAGDGNWHNGSVDTSGHPIWVEYTVQYQQSRRYRFQVNTITASSGHPIRDSRNELIIGKHKVWDRDTADEWNDHDKGSYQPSVFSYDFKSDVPSHSFFNVTIKVLDIELLYSDCMLYGMYEGQRIMQSDIFTIKTTAPFPVTVHVTKPNTSKLPFAWNLKVEWGMELHLSHIGVDCVEPKSTPLEFYWVHTSIHCAFDNGIPVNFLRAMVPKNAPSSLQLPEAPQNVNVHYQQMATAIFNNFSKMYDTIAGASGFGVGAWGGIFALSYYLAPDTGAAGTLYRHVNSMDQSGILQLSCSLSGWTPSWLVQDPFGYIQPTHLVGIADTHGLVNVNNPFFGTDMNRAVLADPNDLSRSMFRRRVYIGNSTPFQPVTDAIYDATGGPHVGTENLMEYSDVSIDTATTLYGTYHQRSGMIRDIGEGVGIMFIDGNYWVAPFAIGSLPEIDQARLATLFERGKADSLPTSPVSSKRLATLEQWVRDTLGAVYEVAFSVTDVGLASTHSTLHLSAVKQGGTDVRVDAYVVASESAARGRLGQIFTTFDRDPTEVFEKGSLIDHGEFCLQYAKDLPAGRIVLVSGNTVVDIRGASSSTALEPIARKLIIAPSDAPGGGTDTDPLPVLSVDFSASRVFPDADSDKSEEGTKVFHVVGLDVWCAYRFVVDSPVAAASAEVQGKRGGVLVSNYVVEELEEGRSAVTFKFVTRKEGQYYVDVHFAHAETFVSGTQDIWILVDA